MNRELELSIIQRCFELHDSKATTLNEAVQQSPVSRYTCEQRFEQEMTSIHRRMPVPWVHSSELEEPNSFRRVLTPLGDIVITRDEQGEVHAFHNVCRHRGSVLVREDSGQSGRLTCPYHAWSYGTDGTLLNVPFEADCFPGIDKTTRALAAVPAVEAHGFVWLCPDADSSTTARAVLDEHLGEMAANLEWLNLDKLQLFRRHARVWKANWKLLSEGGLETYHFRVAHRDTIGPYFLNNVAVQDRLGVHSRVVMPSKKIQEQAELAESERHLRDFTHILFGLAPQSSFLAQEGHVDWIRMTPLTVDETEIEVVSLVPVGEGGLDDKTRKHWDTNFQITLTTLDEDFLIGEGVQRGLATGANTELLFGRNEGLLDSFNHWVDGALASA